MATVTKPIALDESLNTTEQSSRNIADVLAQEIGNLVTVVSRIAPSTTVSWNQIQQSGTKIAQITINGTSTDVYAPTGGGGFSALIIITADAGQTVTATKGGDTYTATEVTPGTYEVTVDSAGTWTISDGTISDTIAIPSSGTYYVTLSSVPDGKTVTPTDDVQILLACAGITDKSYTMISELLADSVSLATVISDNNAMDYLVRSTTWASDVCGDSSAMSYIGLNNYASNTLLGDSTWCSAICNSTYFESVLNVKVPTMTSNTTPSGVASGTSIDGANYNYYQAFSSSTSYGWNPGGSDRYTGKVWYQFTKNQKIYCADIRRNNGASGTTNVKIITSNDGTNWTNLNANAVITNSVGNFNTANIFVFNDILNYDRYGIQMISSSSGTPNDGNGYKAYFYGRADV